MATTKAETKSAAATHDEPSKGEVADSVKELTATLRGDLTKLAGSKADKAITHWQTTLESLGGAGLKGIATELGKLKTLVTDDTPDGAKIAKALSSVSDKVSKVAEEQGGVIGTALTTLSHALQRGSDSLSKAEA